MKKDNNRKLNNMAIFVIIVMIMFMSIISIEVITILYSERTTNDVLKITNKVIKKDKHNNRYDISKLKFKDLIISNEESNIMDICQNGCNLRINMYDMDYHYIFTRKENNYFLNIVKDGKLLLSDKNLGSSLEGAYFRNYLNYIVFYNIVDDGTYVYDYANTVDNRSSLDEFASLESNEMEFTEEGIIYYYDSCYGESPNDMNAKRIKAIRLPYNLSPKVLSQEYTNYTWC